MITRPLSLRLLAFAAWAALALCPLSAQAAHPRLIGDSEILFDAVPLTETVEKSEVDFVVLIPKGRCTPTPQRLAWLGLALEPRPVGIATALLACQLMSSAPVIMDHELKARVIEVDWVDSASAKDVLALGLLDGSTAKRTMVMWWEFYGWRDPIDSRGEFGWFTAEVLGFDVASRRVIWHALQRASMDFGITQNGPYMRLGNYSVSAIIYDAFWAMTDRRAQRSAVQAGGQWLDAESMARPVPPTMARLLLVDQGSRWGSGGLVCPPESPPKPRVTKDCVTVPSHLRGTYTGVELRPGPYTVVAHDKEDAATLDVDLVDGATTVVASTKMLLFDPNKLRLLDAKEATEALSKARQAHYPVGAHRREIDAALFWRGL